MKLSTGLVNKLAGLANLMTNGNFTTDTSGWSTTSSSGTLTSVASGQSGNCLSLANAGAAAGDAYQDRTTVVGRTYRYSFYFKKGTSVSGFVTIGTTGSPASIYTGSALTDAAWTKYSVAFIATATTTRLTFKNTSTISGETSFFDTVRLDPLYAGFRDIMDGCHCAIFKGTQAANADTAANAGDLLETIALNGTSAGLTFSEAVNGVLSIPSGDTWRTETGVNVVQTGDAAWFRFYEAGDDPTTSSTTAARFDGTCGTSATDMIVGQLTRTAGLEDDINGFTYTFPKT